MDMLRVLIGRRNCRGAGLPLGFILETRFLFMGMLAVTLIFTGWIWMQKKEKESYVSQSIQKIETAAGGAENRN
jgi:hypothetical protein